MPRTISEMLERYRRVTGDSYARMSARTRTGGHKGVATASLNNFARGDFKSLPRDREAFEGLARLLNVSPTAIVLAFARELGLEVDAPRFGDLLPPAADTLPDHALDAINNLIRTMIQMGDHKAPPNADSSVPNLTQRDIASGRVRPGQQDDSTHADAGEI